jgi:hypothetical protein
MSWKIYPISEFKNHQDCWQRLNQEGTGSPLLELAFISPMLHAFSSGKEILVRYESDNTLLAMAILSPNSLGRWTTFQPPQAPLLTLLITEDTFCIYLIMGTFSQCVVSH